MDKSVVVFGWLALSPDELRSMPAVIERVEKVSRSRLASHKPTTRELAETANAIC